MTKRAILDMGLASDRMGSQTTFNPISVGGGKPIFNKTQRGFVEMTALWEVWKSLPTQFQACNPCRLSHTSHNALEKPTAEKSLRLSHISTKSAVTF